MRFGMFVSILRRIRRIRGMRPVGESPEMRDGRNRDSAKKIKIFGIRI